MIHIGNEALALMGLLLATVTVLALACFVGPLVLFARGGVRTQRANRSLLAYFVPASASAS